MMDQWLYFDYQRAVSGAVRQALDELDFTIDQAIGYARQDLEFRLDSCPGELAFAMTALAGVVVAQSDPSTYPADGDFVAELRTAYVPEVLDAALSSLDESSRTVFERDVSVARAAFHLS